MDVDYRKAVIHTPNFESGKQKWAKLSASGWEKAIHRHVGTTALT